MNTPPEAPKFCNVVLLKETRALADREFTYRIPPGFRAEAGQLVRVPFGHQGVLPALITRLHHEAPSAFQPKPLAGCISPTGFFTPQQLALLREMARETLTPFAQVALAAIPASLLKLQPHQFAPPTTTIIQLLAENIADFQGACTKRQFEILSALSDLRAESGETAWPLRLLQAEFGASRGVFEKLAQHGALELRNEVAYRCPLNGFTIQQRHRNRLNPEQQSAYEAVLQRLEQPYTPATHRFVLHGITGSGKTEVYMALAEDVMARGKSVLMLVPEIALTGALAERFLQRFGRDRMALWHSQLSHGEKLDTWQRIQHGEIQLVIGARSALFTPIQNLGLLILDEFHDNSFKQDTPAPRYDARDTCNWLSETQHIPIIFGSATPSLGLYHQAVAENGASLLTLNQRHALAKLPQVEVIPMQREREHGHRSPLSRDLADAIVETVSRGEQVILLQNRRGYQTFIHCGSCGHIFECRDCSVSLTWHKQAQVVKCHQCGYQAQRPSYCPKCGTVNLQFVGAGTQKIEQELAALLADRLPDLEMETPVLRLDGDVMQRKGAFREVLDAFRHGKSAILVGTQMVAKGLDVPNVTLVGVLGADAPFYLPDYAANERGFQLLTQVAGRAGRGGKAGRVLLQTLQPDHPVLQLAMKQEMHAFYELEILQRRAYRYPPFSRLMRLIISGEELERVRFFAGGLRQTLQSQLEAAGLGGGEAYQLLGPSPCTIERIQAKWRYHLLIKSFQHARVHAVLGAVLKQLSIPEGLHCLVDTHAQSLL